jgi:hypothetical protein
MSKNDTSKSRLRKLKMSSKKDKARFAKMTKLKSSGWYEAAMRAVGISNERQSEKAQ